MEEKEKVDIEKLIEQQQEIVLRAPCPVVVRKKVYNVKQVSNAVRRRISLLEREAYFLEQEANLGVTLKRAKKIEEKIRTLHSKTAAYYVLNNVAIFFPFIYGIRWRTFELKDSEVTYRINEAGMNNRGADFFLANWQITKAQLALSTRLVGEGIKQYQERMESVENMLAKDASGINKDSK